VFLEDSGNRSVEVFVSKQNVNCLSLARLRLFPRQVVFNSQTLETDTMESSLSRY